MHLQQPAFAQAVIALALCFSSAALAASIPSHASTAAAPDGQLLPVNDQYFHSKLKGSTLTAFCAFKGSIPAEASVDLNSCIENSSGEMLFVDGGANALRTCSNCVLKELNLQCDCSTPSASSKLSAIDLDGKQRGDGSGVFALVSGELVCRSGGQRTS